MQCSLHDIEGYISQKWNSGFVEKNISSIWFADDPSLTKYVSFCHFSSEVSIFSTCGDGHGTDIFWFASGQI